MTPVVERIDQVFDIEAFSDHVALAAGNGTNTVEAYARDIRRLAEFATSKGATEPAQVTRTLLRDFIFLLKDLGLSSATIRREISAVRTYFAFLLGEDRITDDPSDRLESPQRWRHLPEVLTVGEIESPLAAPHVDEPMAWGDRALLGLAYGVGLGVGERCQRGPSDRPLA